MTVEAKVDHGKAAADDRPFAHLRATPEYRAEIAASTLPFDGGAWLREMGEPTAEDLEDLEAFLREREEQRRFSLERQEARVAELGE